MPIADASQLEVDEKKEEEKNEWAKWIRKETEINCSYPVCYFVPNSVVVPMGQNNWVSFSYFLSEYYKNH